MIDIFTKAQFERVLSSLGYKWEHSFEKGEHVYYVMSPNIPNKKAGVSIRSSIGISGYAGEVGENSIRLTLVTKEGEFLAKSPAYVTRLPGWENRMMVKLEFLFSLREAAGDCPICGKPLMALEVKKEGRNKGRYFAACREDHKLPKWLWLDEKTVPYWEEGNVYAPDPDLVEEIEKSDLDTREKISVNEEKITSKSESDILLELGFDLPEKEKKMSNPFVLDLQSPTEIVVSSDIHYTEEQRNVIESEAKVIRVLAVPGSGKSATLRGRYKSLVEKGIPPEKIAVITYTKSMANEFLAKLQKDIPEFPQQAKDLVSTIHAFCFRFLKKLEPSFSTVQVPMSWEINKVIEGSLAKSFPISSMRPGKDETYSWISTRRAYFIDIDKAEEFYSRSMTEEYAHAVYEADKELMKFFSQNNKIDFSGMLYFFEKALLEKPFFGNVIRAQVKHLFVDEAQDTNFQTMRILQKLKIDNLVLVGDSDQMMFRFAGATPEDNLGIGFDERYPEAETYFLTVNFRSTRRLIESFSNVIAKNYEDFGGPYPEKYRKVVHPSSIALEGEYPFLTEYENAREEAIQTVELIKKLLEKGYVPGDIFIGARTKAQLVYSDMVLSTTEIPFVNISGSSFWSQQYISIILDYLGIMLDGNDREAFDGVLNVPSKNFKMDWEQHSEFGNYVPYRFFKAKECAEACLHSMRGAWDLHKASFTKGKRPAGWSYAYVNGLRDFINLTQELSGMKKEGASLSEVIDFLTKEVVEPYIQAKEGFSLQGEDGVGFYLDDIKTMKDVAETFESISDFLSFARKMKKRSKDSREKETEEKVVLSTAHSLKGKERKIVFALGVSEGVEGSSGLLPHTFSLVPPPNTGKLPGQGQGRVEDELCIFYVIGTRAKELLFVSSIKEYRGEAMKQSRFLSYL